MYSAVELEFSSLGPWMSYKLCSKMQGRCKGLDGGGGGTNCHASMKVRVSRVFKKEGLGAGRITYEECYRLARSVHDRSLPPPPPHRRPERHFQGVLSYIYRVSKSIGPPSRNKIQPKGKRFHLVNGFLSSDGILLTRRLTGAKIIERSPAY